MATVTSSDAQKTDEYGIERNYDDEPGLIDKYRAKWKWFDHIMLMVERYNVMGGNQFAASITYFSVLAIFPILMLVVAGLSFFLAADPARLEALEDQLTAGIDGQMGEMLTEVLSTAIDQRNAVAGIGAITALFSGLGWMNNLRFGVSQMWRVDPTNGNPVLKKVLDLVGLIGLLISFAIAFGVTAIGSSGITDRIIEFFNLSNVPGISVAIFLVSLIIGIIANFFVVFWMIVYLPRTKVPRRSAVYASIIGAIAFEVVKQLGSLFASNALSNPAGATFGPIIGLMVVMYLIWRIVLYVSAWAATTEESLAVQSVKAPDSAVIRVRNEIREGVSPSKAVGIGAVAVAVGAGLATLLRKK